MKLSKLLLGAVTAVLSVALLTACGSKKKKLTTRPDVTMYEWEVQKTAHKAKPEFPEGSPAAKHGALHVDGQYMVDEKGEKFQLRGFSSYNLSASYMLLNKTTLTELRDVDHVNAIRLAMYTEGTEGVYCSKNCSYAAQCFEYVEKSIKACSEVGLYVIIDWHILHDRTPMKYYDLALDFFDRMSFIYRDYTNVLYELCNEPNGEDVTWNIIKDYAEDAIEVIRSNGAENICIVGTPTWSQRVDIAAKKPIKMDKNVMYTVHFYAGSHGEDHIAQLQAAIDNKLPVFCTEFNITEESGNGHIDTDMGDKWMKVMDDNNISYFIWSFSKVAESSALLNVKCEKFSGFEKTDWNPCGVWYLDHLAQQYEVNPQ